jgi:uncharacterized protein involved in tolerance to divalent cations
MINVYVYLTDKEEAENLATRIVEEQIAANASIDIDNNYYELIAGRISKKVHVVITFQTKALLFKHLTDLVESVHGNQVPIFASPLISANAFFDEFIRNNTKKV